MQLAITRPGKRFHLIPGRHQLLFGELSGGILLLKRIRFQDILVELVSSSL